MKFSKAEIEAVIAASPRITVPYNKLSLSQDYQVRPSGSTSKMSIAELAASIKASGVLQNLIVIKGLRGQFEVCAGGRRLESLNVLVTGGDIPDNYPVPVLVVPADKALIASLAENCFHVPMHAADEFIAFAKLIAEGKSVEDVAAAFGVTPLVVKRRMKLSTVSPKLMVLFRDEKISLDCLMVLASIDDHERQEQTWANLPSWNRSPDHLRQMLTQGEIDSGKDSVARFVTLKAYEKAGGTLRRDLFSDNDKTAYLLDPPLLERLAIDKLQKVAKQIAVEGWKWIEVRARYSFEEFSKHGELRKARRTPDAQEATAIAELEAQIATRHERMETLADQENDDAGEDAEFLKLEAEAEGLQEQVKVLEDALSVWPAELVAQAGCVVFVGNAGTAEIKRGLIRPEDRNIVVDAAREAGKGGADHGTRSALVSLPAANTRPVHSEKLMRRLTAHRVAAIQAELMFRPDVALAAITAQLAIKLIKDGFQRYRGGDDALNVSATDTHDGLRGEAEDMAESPAWKQFDTERQAWFQRLPRTAEAVLPWLLQQEQATVVQLLTLLVASSVTGVSGVERDRQSTDALAVALNLDMTKWWAATGASYLSHVSKSRILDVVTEAADANAASPLAALKKDDAVKGAEQTIASTGWLPACLRTKALSATPANAEPREAAEEHAEPVAV